ncbi:MAG: hypothetical protein KGL10_01505 [Alphaproteobacteria bacterium]|nr:hypothetical protein [Alphaproteobacteria bacterium]MDE2335963.1 hypothetical protein [Alphaproteobacteria bacterium]
MPARGVKAQNRLHGIKLALAAALGANFLFWCGSQSVYERWSGVPPVPDRTGAVMMTLGDPEFSYRVLALSLQNLGNLGVDVAPLKDYDYRTLGKWFFLLSSLDPVSDHVPALAAYYFGATRAPSDVAVVVRYLAAVGQEPFGDKWRWLVQAVYLAQHRMYDENLALQLAEKLADMPQSVDMPAWARQMPAFVLEKKGDRAAARALMADMLRTQKNLSPEDIGNMTFFLVHQAGMSPQEVSRLLRRREER